MINAGPMPSCYFCGVRNAFIASHAPGACCSSHATCGGNCLFEIPRERGIVCHLAEVVDDLFHLPQVPTISPPADSKRPGDNAKKTIGTKRPTVQGLLPRYGTCVRHICLANLPNGSLHSSLQR